ncbi:hypothetical protein KR009_002195, partial [Drosophila setifemur]
MNQVWVFFKVIEVLLGSLCMFFHMRGELMLTERIPHVIVFCATFLSFATLAALGAFRLLLTRSCVLSAQLVLTLSAAFAHYFCGLLVMRSVLQDPHLFLINSTIAYMEHPHIAYCKQQSIGAIVTGTMYMMHMFHVLDLLMRLKPGDWRRQATGIMQCDHLGIKVGNSTGLFVLSKPVDDFLCKCCHCYESLARSQPMQFRQYTEEESQFVFRMWRILAEARRKLLRLDVVESEESFLSTPTITTSETDNIAPALGNLFLEEEVLRTATTWRGTSDSSSLWAQIEDRSSPIIATTMSSPSNKMPYRVQRNRMSISNEVESREKSEILLVEQGSSYAHLRTLDQKEVV